MLNVHRFQFFYAFNLSFRYDRRLKQIAAGVHVWPRIDCSRQVGFKRDIRYGKYNVDLCVIPYVKLIILNFCFKFNLSFSLALHEDVRNFRATINAFGHRITSICRTEKIKYRCFETQFSVLDSFPFKLFCESVRVSSVTLPK